MQEPTWLPRIAKFDEAYLLVAEDGLAEEDGDTYLALSDADGRQYRLRLAPAACSALYDTLTSLLQSRNTPLRKLSPSPNQTN